MSALTKISFKLMGFMKAKTGGSLKILHNSGCLCMVVQCSRTMLDKLLSAGWYVMTNGTLLFAFISLYWITWTYIRCASTVVNQKLPEHVTIIGTDWTHLNSLTISLSHWLLYHVFSVLQLTSIQTVISVIYLYKFRPGCLILHIRLLHTWQAGCYNICIGRGYQFHTYF